MTTEVCVSPESLWFAGHFPGDPVLPGVAQLGMAYDTVCKARPGLFKLIGFSRVKFKKIIRPLDRLKIHVMPKRDKEGVFSFRILVGDDIACSGNMTLEAGGTELRVLPDISDQGVRLNEQH
ncbi:MAG: FabA/FabZ family ACP-dehydratase [Desulfobacterales bacterium]